MYKLPPSAGCPHSGVSGTSIDSKLVARPPLVSFLFLFKMRHIIYLKLLYTN